MSRSAPTVQSLRGLWQRSLIAWPDGSRDVTTSVRWLQGLRTYIDLRQPAPLPDLSQVRCLDDLSREDCAALAQQEGFAGHFAFDGTWFEWARAIDYQPKPLYSDAGSLWWEDNVLVETGRDVAYVEHWHRDDALPTSVAAAVALIEKDHGTLAYLLRVGPLFMFARDRAIIPPQHQTLSECVAEAPSLDHAIALVDCEISFGSLRAEGFVITASSLPFRVGDILDPSLAGDDMTTRDRATTGDVVTRHWAITESEGEVRALDADLAVVAGR